MAQREEETELKVPDNLTLCVNNCSRPGNPATKNMCQSCFQAALSLTPPPCYGHDKPRSGPIRPQKSEPADLGRRDRQSEAVPVLVASVAPARMVSRCSGCRRKVGLTGFRCRCGDLFCAEHRYSDRHECSFDYKAAGREAIERENPVVKAAKIVRI